MKLLLENWRGYLNEDQGKTLRDYHDVFFGMMKDWQEPVEGFPKKEYEELFYVKVNLSASPLDGNPLKELIGKRVRITKGSRELIGQEATIKDIQIWTKHKTGRDADRGVQATLVFEWDEDIISQMQKPGAPRQGPCGLDRGDWHLWCAARNEYGIELL